MCRALGALVSAGNVFPCAASVGTGQADRKQVQRCFEGAELDGALESAGRGGGQGGWRGASLRGAAGQAQVKRIPSRGHRDYRAGRGKVPADPQARKDQCPEGERRAGKARRRAEAPPGWACEARKALRPPCNETQDCVSFPESPVPLLKHSRCQVPLCPARSSQLR